MSALETEVRLVPAPRASGSPAAPAVRTNGASVLDGSYPATQLRYDATVPRQLVHRSSVAEVFLTDSAVAGPDRYDIAAQLPRRHPIGESGQVYDPLLIVEAVRQAGVLIAHRYLGVDVENPFIFRALDMRVLDLPSTRIGATPARALFSMEVTEDRSRGGRLQGLVFRGEGSLDGVACLRGEGHLLFLSRGAYHVLRTRGRQARLLANSPGPATLVRTAPRTVGRRDPRNVVITEPVLQGDGRFGASLVVDVTHPYLFDHALDHVPGNLELEACRQLALAAVARQHGFDPAGLAVTACAGDFGEFAELDVLTRVSAHVDDLQYDLDRRAHVVPVRLEMTQGGAVVASATLEVTTGMEAMA